MKKVLIFTFLFIRIMSLFGMDNVIDSIQTYVNNDSLFNTRTKGLKIYVWKEKFEKKHLYGEISLIKKFSVDKVKSDIIHSKFLLSELYNVPLSVTNWRKTKKERKWDGIWNGKTAIIKFSDIYKHNEETAYCLVRVYARRMYIDYNFFLKKVNDAWVIDEKYVISDFII